MERLIERGLFASRWLLAPMYVGLIATVVMIVWVFAVELIAFVAKAPSINVNGGDKLCQMAA